MEQERKSGNERTKPETNVTVNENKVSVTANENMASVTASVEIVAANANIAGVSINIEKDSLKEENGCLIDNEQSKPSETVQKSGANDNAFPNPPEQLLLLDGRLRDLPTFLTTCRRRQSKGTDDMPGSKIPTSILRIGSWEYISTNENGLAAIFWFGEQMLVWEVIAGGKKNHILIQWCDIVALKASCPDNEPGTLTIVLARQPTFISTKYPKPQHRECNIWEVTPDCTHGQASIHRTHFLQFPQGILKAQFEKLIQCDMRLRLLSQQPEIVLDSPYFEHHSSVSEDQDEAKGQDIDQVISDFQDLASPSAGHSPTLEIGKGDIAGETSEHMSQEAPPSSATASGTKTASDTADKPKVFQVSASILRIGSWEYNSRNEGELVVKCYFGKKRLIWEVLEGSTKSKIEINWCDIIALKASCPDNEPGTLTIVLGRQPSFFSSRDPDHRRWYSTRDFTNGQASIHRQHFLQFQQGLLNEFQKLIQCDMHLKHLSQQPGMILDSPYFENQSFVSENQIQYTIQSVSDFQDQASPSASQSCSVKIGKGDVAGKTLVIKVHFEEAPPSSGSN